MRDTTRPRLQAIPTVYAGTQFRSRLEASFAQHFDHRGMPWVYEPEAFTLSDGTNYLPDFWLPTARAWAEIKGPHNERVAKVERFAAELWAESGADLPGRCGIEDPKAPLIVLFEQPYRSPRGHLNDTAYPMAVRGIGKRASAAFARCMTCHAHTIITMWQRNCRNCGHIYPDSVEAWANDFAWRFGVPFEYIRSDYKR